MTSPLPTAVAERLESIEALDPPAKKLGKLVRDAIPKGPVKDALSGTFLGHALHPILTDIPIGTWTSALLLDVIGAGECETAAQRLIGAGLAATAPTLATGWSDWADAEPASDEVRRAGIVHASLNASAVGLMTASLIARRRGATARGRVLTIAGIGMLTAGGWLGGHLSYALGVGVDTTVFDKDLDNWAATGLREGDVQEGQPRCVRADGVPVMVVRDGGELKALHNRCAHRGGSLADGEVSGGTVTCPLHGSVFRLDDGSVERGPSAYPQPVYETRVVSDGEVEVRLAAH